MTDKKIEKLKEDDKDAQIFALGNAMEDYKEENKKLKEKKEFWKKRSYNTGFRLGKAEARKIVEEFRKVNCYCNKGKHKNVRCMYCVLGEELLEKLK